MSKILELDLNVKIYENCFKTSVQVSNKYSPLALLFCCILMMIHAQQNNVIYNRYIVSHHLFTVSQATRSRSRFWCCSFNDTGQQSFEVFSGNYKSNKTKQTNKQSKQNKTFYCMTELFNWACSTSTALVNTQLRYVCGKINLIQTMHSDVANFKYFNCNIPKNKKFHLSTVFMRNSNFYLYKKAHHHQHRTCDVFYNGMEENAHRFSIEHLN